MPFTPANLLFVYRLRSNNDGKKVANTAVNVKLPLAVGNPILNVQITCISRKRKFYISISRTFKFELNSKARLSINLRPFCLQNYICSNKLIFQPDILFILNLFEEDKSKILSHIESSPCFYSIFNENLLLNFPAPWLLYARIIQSIYVYTHDIE